MTVSNSDLETGGAGRVMVTAALLLAMAVTALEQTVVSTAMPSIIASLQGLDIYPWVFSAYLLACTISTPIYGKLADIWGRKRLLLFGLSLFSLGSILSGQSTSMGMLIAMRVIQGLGAGAVGPIVLTMMGDLYTLRERAVVQSLFSGVWGISSLAGPALGGVLTDQLSWRWVFYVTVPFGLVSAFILVRHVDEEIKAKPNVGIDWQGALMLAIGTTLLLLAVLQGPQATLARVLACLISGLVVLVLFVLWERKVPNPILPLDLITRGPIAAAIIMTFGIGTLLFGIDTYIPLYVQGVRGGSATHAGTTMTPLFMSWAISVFISVWVVIRLGFRATGMAGGALISIGTACLVAGTNWPAFSRELFTVGMIIVGLGFGPASLTCVLSCQHAVTWDQRGVATAAVTFFRTMGGALGVGFLGATLAYEFAGKLLSAGAKGIDVVAALRPETHVRLTPEQLAVVQTALGQTLRDVFLQMFAVSLLVLFATVGLVSGRPSPPGQPRPDDEHPDHLELAALPD